jgi:hypothetical protein
VTRLPRLLDLAASLERGDFDAEAYAARWGLSGETARRDERDVREALDVGAHRDEVRRVCASGRRAA